MTPPKAGRQRSPTPSRRRRRNKRRYPQKPPPLKSQSSTENPAEAAMFELVLRSSRDELRQQLQSIIGNLDATATFKDGLTALSAYMLFVLHYLENHLTTANLHNWPIISHASLRHLTSRQAFTAAVARPWGDIPGTEVADVVKFLISSPSNDCHRRARSRAPCKGIVVEQDPFSAYVLARSEGICHLRRECAYLGVPCACKLLPGSSLESQSMVPLGAWNHPSGSCGNPYGWTSFSVRC